MLIYLSEELLNSLFKVLNETSVSGSYDEKVNRLKRSGVLSDSQDFTCHQTLNKTVEAGNLALLKPSYQKLYDLAVVCGAIKATSETVWERTRAKVIEQIMVNGQKPDEFQFQQDLNEQNDIVRVLTEYAVKLDAQYPEKDYIGNVKEMLEGKANKWARDGFNAQTAYWLSPELQAQAKSIIDKYIGLNISLERVANETSEKLDNFFPDGTYNYTFIMFPTVVYPNGDAGNGTCQITSQYEVNTQGLVQKLWNQNYQSSVNKELHYTSLQTMEISNNFRYIASIGSSFTGKYSINENTCTIIYYGYSIRSGEFTTFKTSIIKTSIGFIFTTCVLNNNSETLRSVVYYTKV